MKKIFIVITLAIFLNGAVFAEINIEKYGTFLDKVEKEAFDYFMQETNWLTGFTRNTSRA
jgi:hypothetical protein